MKVQYHAIIGVCVRTKDRYTLSVFTGREHVWCVPALTDADGRMHLLLRA